MIGREDALQKIAAAAWQLPTQSIPLEHASGRVLAEDVYSDVDLPPFPKSSMDGYACRAEDAFETLRVLEHIPAGSVPTHPITPGTCSKIMTGAPVPEGADCILIVEEVAPLDDHHIRFTGTTPKSNICPQGEDVQTGDVVLRPGLRLSPAHLPVLASVGCTHPTVSAQPRVTVFATGDELVPWATVPPAGKIRNSNSIQLSHLAQCAGAVATDRGIAPDARERMIQQWDEALEEDDVIISTGGVSMGDYDLVPEILQHHGFDIHFDRVAIQPGKPVLFGTRGTQACFGLSGNPVSSYLQFMLFVTPFLLRLQGHTHRPPGLPVILGQDFTRKNGAREGWIPVALNEAHQAVPITFHGSAHIHSFTAADGLIAFPAGTTQLHAGDSVFLRLLHGNDT